MGCVNLQKVRSDCILFVGNPGDPRMTVTELSSHKFVPAMSYACALRTRSVAFGWWEVSKLPLSVHVSFTDWGF